MKYEVVWTERAEELLADFWNRAADRNAVTEAANTIDRDLARHPRQAGEPRFGTTRVLVEEPLIVLFDVIEDDHRVRVIDVWRVE